MGTFWKLSSLQEHSIACDNLYQIGPGWGFAQHPSDAGEGCVLLLLQLLRGKGGRCFCHQVSLGTGQFASEGPAHSQQH